jgi:L-ascorbate metabolism protein UlaG (beta-lactamase superfamily)
MKLTWLGHATLLLETPGARLITDPVLRDRVMHLRRQVPTPVGPGQVDGVLLSHIHHDHFDKPSLRKLASQRTTACLPHGAAKMIAGMGYGTVREVSAGDAFTLGDASVHVVPAWHDGRRRPGPGAKELETLGYLVDDVWFAGDTDLDDGMAALRGAVDVALIPIWGWGSSLGPGHLDPKGAARAMALVQPRIAVPIHWGTFFPYGVRPREFLTAPPRDFARHMAELAPATRVELLFPGGALTL